MKLNQTTTLWVDPEVDQSPVRYAISALQRDWRQVVGRDLVMVTALAPNQIRLVFTPTTHEEGFRVWCHDETALFIGGQDDLGVVFGIYHFCETVLGVDPLGFWTDYEPPRRSEIPLDPFLYTSPKPAVRFRGWFVNDE